MMMIARFCCPIENNGVHAFVTDRQEEANIMAMMTTTVVPVDLTVAMFLI